MHLRIGTSGYSYKEWKGSFYPQNLPMKKLLQYYSERFRTVEINYTFRAMPKVALLESWASEVPDNFQFVLKAPQQITHIKRLRDVGDAVAHLFAVAGVLQQRLGPVLFQLPPNMKKDVSRLANLLALVPRERRAALEFRHQSWFDDEVFTVLRDHQAALCIAEAENDLDIPFVSTANWGYVRLRNPDYTDAELQAWRDRVRQEAWEDAYVFLKHEDEGKGPRMAARLMELDAIG